MTGGGGEKPGLLHTSLFGVLQMSGGWWRETRASTHFSIRCIIDEWWAVERNQGFYTLFYSVYYR